MKDFAASVRPFVCLIVSTHTVEDNYPHSEPRPGILGLILVKGWSFDYALFGEDLVIP